MVYAEDLKSLTSNGLWVRVPPPAYKFLKCAISCTIVAPEIGRPPIAQLVEQSPLKRTVVGSIPTGRTSERNAVLAQAFPSANAQYEILGGQDMYDHAPTDYHCPLCLIAQGKPTERGDQEPEVIFRNEHCTAFVAGKWWRSNPGHVIVIPNQHVENLYDLPNTIGHAIMDLSKQVALALKTAYGCEGISVRQHNEPAGNQDVWHYHLHVFPRYSGDDLYLRHRDTYWPSAEEKRPYAEKLKHYFVNIGR